MKKIGNSIFTGVMVMAVSLVLASGASAAKPQYCIDTDLDGFGDPNFCQSTKQDPYLVRNGDDCNDADASVNPDATEICDDGIDNDCANGVDDGCSAGGGVKPTWYRDSDSDGYGDINSTREANRQPRGYVADSSDCNDNDSSVNPGASEIPDNGTDDDCSGADTVTCIVDADQDGYGTTLATTTMAIDGSCDAADSESASSDDCNDANSLINPGATEIPDNGTDDDCSGADTVACIVDADQDGYGTTLATTTMASDGSCDTAESESTTSDDCNDGVSAINPGEAEIYGDPIDQNCDGDIGPYFPDQNLEACVLEHTVGSLDPADLALLTSLSCNYKQITDISGMEYLTGLSSLEINSTLPATFSDLSPIENLTGLTSLSVNSNRISDVSPLQNLTALTNLSLFNNLVSDLTPLQGLTSLVSLNLRKNNIIDLQPLRGLVNVSVLGLGDNSIENLAGLEGMAGLTSLRLDMNNISDLSPLNDPNLAGMVDLDVSYNDLTTVASISELTGLKSLELYLNQIVDISGLASLSQLEFLDMTSNNVSDTTALENLPALSRLSLNFNPITELPTLINPGGLTYLETESTSISDYSDLSNYTGLTILNISRNSITDISFLANSGLQLNVLFMHTNNISDLTPLATVDISQMGWLDFSWNQVVDVTPLSNLTWCDVYVEGNCITDFSPLYINYNNIIGEYQQCM